MARTVGVVFPFFQPPPTLTVVGNVMLLTELRRSVPAKQRCSRAGELLDRVGLAALADDREPRRTDR
ncbi:hypothetical protein [Micromonospora sp. ATCC 39149]|uniref:Uncharacterized protein n=1 Tax=Micromonospora carbonacea TaxID=47853 RepID=A0A7D6C9J0_9ACTN|nr:hypothetical protein [Micromonospora sp. ATCC 39149]QLJ96882.1 hypothetical protein HZU44_18525 [Micromonospora carbonacea]